MLRPFATSDAGLKLRLSAFAFADVVNYTRHLETDTVAAIRVWSGLRKNVLQGEMNKFSGRMVSGSGDAVLLEFPSATWAVQWALSVQARIRALPDADEPMQIRIGINIDDVVDDGETLQSDGVVIAARIHHFAAPGEVVLTQLARDIVCNRLNIRFRDLGTPTLKNIGHPVRVFAVEENSTEKEPVRPHFNWDSRPTLAILPFVDIEAPEAERYFGEGITEDIITGISRSRALFVVARTSALQFAESKETPHEIASALGVKYLLLGSVRRKGEKLRIHTELVDVIRDRALAADNYDGKQDDIFDFQDRIVASIVAALEPKLLRAEAAHLGGRPTESLDAYDCVLRALPELFRLDESSYERALDLLERAVSLDPDYAQAHGYLAWCLTFWIAEGHSKRPEQDRTRAIAHARRGVELDPLDALTLSIRGHLLSLLEGRVHEALDMLEQALTQNENLPIAWGLSATSYAYLGNGAEARERLLNVWRLTPHDPLNFFFWTAGGLAEFVDSNYEGAIRHLQRVRQSKPHFMASLRLLAASLSMDGKTEEAHIIATEILETDPNFSIAKLMAWYPLQSADARERLILGLSAAGLPK